MSMKIIHTLSELRQHLDACRHPAVVPHLAVDDVLFDAMRGRSTIWWRVRVNLRHVPAADLYVDGGLGGAGV